MIIVYTAASELDPRISRLMPYWAVPGYEMAHVIVYHSRKEVNLATRIADNVAVDMVRHYELEGMSFFVSYQIDEELEHVREMYHLLHGDKKDEARLQTYGGQI